MTIDVAKGTARGNGADTFVAHNTHILGSRHADVIRGSARADYLDGSFGSDRLVGRGGNDLLVTDDVSEVYRGGADVALGGLGNDSIIAGGGRDQLYGSRGNDQLNDSGASADVLYGGPGRDVLYNELFPGREVLAGGTGARDELVLWGNKINPSAQPAQARWTMSTGTMTYTPGATPAQAVARGLERLSLYTWGTSWTITGTDGPDTVTASGSAGTRFYALGGNDVFDGSYYDDLFDGGTGSDTAISMGHGTDTCHSVERFDMLLSEQDCESIS
jgi:Ca2+-binding RTX toxin-like protein